MTLLLLTVLVAPWLLTTIAYSAVVSSDFQQCDRECRFHFGFYNRSITGVRVGALDHEDSWGRHCDCKNISSSSSKPFIDRTSLKPWDTVDFWCGAGGGLGFNTTYVCVLDNQTHDQVRTMTVAEAQKSKVDNIIHCGKCAACSHPSDVHVLYNTRTFITTEMTRCAAAFAKPKFLGGDRDLDLLRTCLTEANIIFDNTIRFQGNGPTCMECWTDNIMCDSSLCNTNPYCIAKFFNPNNTGAFSGCLKCDEKHCGAEFIRCAGANRRSSGIISDIQRVGDEVCPHGMYWQCSLCHQNCTKDDQGCNKACEQSASCKKPLSQMLKR